LIPAQAGISDGVDASVGGVKLRPSSSRSSVLAAAFGLIAVACSSARSRTGPDLPAEPSPSAAPADPIAGTGPAASVPEVLDFSAPQLGGGTLEGASFAGEDDAIWFWAPW